MRVTSVRVFVCVYVCVCLRVCVYVCLYVYVYMCICLFVYVYMCVGLFVCVYMCVCLSACLKIPLLLFILELKHITFENFEHPEQTSRTSLVRKTHYNHLESRTGLPRWAVPRPRGDQSTLDNRSFPCLPPR